jgi:hypothetical protein
VDVGGGAVVVVGLRGEICTGARVCACWVLKLGNSSGVFKLGCSKFGCSGRGVL